jgi:hypothetical protein
MPSSHNFPRVPASPRRRSYRPFKRKASLRRAARDMRRAAGVDQASQRILLGAVMPMWVIAGLADWYCHRKTDIEHTAGLQESVSHAAMMTQSGIPTTLALFYEVNAGVLATTYAALAAHQATAFYDVRYANESTREISDWEQHVHGMLEQVPVMATAFLTAIHWDQARALAGRGNEKPRWKLEPKRYPLPHKVKAGVLGSVAAFVALPYAEELYRCWKARDSQSADQDLKLEAVDKPAVAPVAAF